MLLHLFFLVVDREDVSFYIYILSFCQIRKENEHSGSPNGFYGNKGLVNLLKVMPRVTKEHEVNCIVYNSKIKPVCVLIQS